MDLMELSTTWNELKEQNCFEFFKSMENGEFLKFGILYDLQASCRVRVEIKEQHKILKN